METEFEAKFYPIKKEEVRQKLNSLGAELIQRERKLVRVTADARSGSSVLFPKNTYLRVRDEGNLVRLSLKVTADENGKLDDQKEIDVEVSDFDKTVKILEGLGVVFNNYQETLREEWKFKGAEITIDTWPGLETYSEIETDSEEKVKEIADQLGFNWDKKIITASPEIYAKVYGLDIEDVLLKLKNISFENNPFEGLTKVWNGD